MKPPTFAPAYVGLFPILSEVAQSNGYALAAHGSVSRDFDLVAIPWTAEAKPTKELVAAMFAAVSASMGRFDGNGTPLGEPEKKPHGRLTWSIPVDCGACLDLSVVAQIEATKDAFPPQPEVIEGRGITAEWFESIGGLPGDEQPVELAVTIWEKDEHTRMAEDKGPFMHLVWSSADSALFLEVYDKDGKTLAAFELDVPSTQESALNILRALGQKITPRPAFQAPPKPEPLYRLYRITRGDRQGQFYWGLPAGGSAEGKGADLFIDSQSNFHNFSWCEEVTKTGEPIAKE